MKRSNLMTLAAVAAVTTGLTLATGTFPAAHGGSGKPCARNSFETKLVKSACKEGGQPAAMKAMKSFVKDVKKAKDGVELTCKTCHTKLMPDFPNKEGALDKFREYAKLVNVE